MDHVNVELARIRSQELRDQARHPRSLQMSLQHRGCRQPRRGSAALAWYTA